MKPKGDLAEKLPKSSVTYLDDAELRKAVDAVLSQGHSRFPDGLMLGDIEEFYQAQTAAFQIKSEWPIALYKLWVFFWLDWCKSTLGNRFHKVPNMKHQGALGYKFSADYLWEEGLFEMAVELKNAHFAEFGVFVDEGESQAAEVSLYFRLLNEDHEPIENFNNLDSWKKTEANLVWFASNPQKWADRHEAAFWTEVDGFRSSVGEAIG